MPAPKKLWFISSRPRILAPGNQRYGHALAPMHNGTTFVHWALSCGTSGIRYHKSMKRHSLLLGSILVLLIVPLSAAPKQQSLPKLDRDVVATVKGWGAPGEYDTVAPEPDLNPQDWVVLACPPSVSKGICEASTLDWIRKSPSPGHAFKFGDSTYKWKRLAPGAATSEIACAVAEFMAPTDEVRMVHAPGIETVWVDGVPFQGDPKHSGFLGSPVALKKGLHRIVAPNPGANWAVRFWKPRTQVVLAHWATSPSAQTREDVMNPFVMRFVPAFNASLSFIDDLHIHHGSPRGKSNGEPYVSEWRCGREMQPLEFVDMYTGDSAGPGHISSDDTAAQYMLIAFTSGTKLCSVAKAELQLVTESKRPPSSRGWVISFPKDMRPSLSTDKTMLSADSLAKWFQQRILHDTNGWCRLTYSEDPYSAGFMNRSHGPSFLFIGNPDNNKDLAAKLKGFTSSSKASPAPPTVGDGRMTWNGEEFVGPDWFFVYRPNAETCFALVTGPEALVGLAHALSSGPTTFVSARPSK